MEKKNLNRLRHILDACQSVCQYIEGEQRDALDSNRMLLSAIVRELEIIGEAANSLSPDFREEHPDIPWKQIIGMRNRLIHAYFDIDQDIVWQTVTIELPKLISQIAPLIP